MNQKNLKTRVFLTQDVACQYESEMGQSIRVKLPRGLILDLPSAWIYGHIPAMCIADESHQTIAKLPADWFEDSSLETWFPLTAKQISRFRMAELLHPLPELTCIECGRSIPAGLSQWCVKGGLCVWRAPLRTDASREAQIKTDQEYLECLREDHAEIMEELRGYLDADDEIIHGIRKLKAALAEQGHKGATT